MVCVIDDGSPKSKLCGVLDVGSKVGLIGNIRVLSWANNNEKLLIAIQNNKAQKLGEIYLLMPLTFIILSRPLLLNFPKSHFQQLLYLMLFLLLVCQIQERLRLITHQNELYCFFL